MAGSGAAMVTGMAKKPTALWEAQILSGRKHLGRRISSSAMARDKKAIRICINEQEPEAGSLDQTEMFD